MPNISLKVLGAQTTAEDASAWSVCNDSGAAPLTVPMLCVLWATPARPDSGILRIPLAHVAREHRKLNLTSDADELSVVTLNAPLSIVSFDNRMRNETELFFLRPAPSRFNTSQVYNAPHHNGEAIVAGVLPVTVKLSHGADILVGGAKTGLDPTASGLMPARSPLPFLACH